MCTPQTRVEQIIEQDIQTLSLIRAVKRVIGKMLVVTSGRVSGACREVLEDGVVGGLWSSR